MRKGTRLAALLPLGLLTLGATIGPLARGDSAWERRAEGEREGRADPRPISDALRAYEEALRRQPGDLQVRWKLLRALHFAGEFAPESEAAARGLFERATVVSDDGRERLAAAVGASGPLERRDPAEALALLRDADVRPSDVARFYFWSAINWGAWSRAVGLLGAVRQGVADRLHRYSLLAIALEPQYDDGGPLRLLGRLHAELPRVPFLSGWVDRDRALVLIERAHGLAPENPGNRLLLALTLLDLEPERRSEAFELLRQVEALEPRAAMRIEDLAVRAEARRQLAAR